MIQSLASGLMERAKFQQGFKVGFPIKISTIVISKQYETIIMEYFKVYLIQQNQKMVKNIIDRSVYCISIRCL